MAAPPPSNMNEKKANHSPSGVHALTHAEQSVFDTRNVLLDSSAFLGIVLIVPCHGRKNTKIALCPSKNGASPFLEPVSPRTHAGRGPDFENKNRAIFSGELFSGEEFLEQHYCPRTLFPSMSVEWIHFPRIRTFVQKRFHNKSSR